MNKTMNILRRLKQRLMRGFRRAPRVLNLNPHNVPGFQVVTGAWETEGGQLAFAKVQPNG